MATANKDEETKDKDDMNDTKNENAGPTKITAKTKKQGQYSNVNYSEQQLEQRKKFAAANFAGSDILN